MEGTIQLNRAGSIDFPACSGKSIQKGKGETVKKLFGDILLEMQDANELEGGKKLVSKVCLDEEAEDCQQHNLSCAIAVVEPELESLERKNPFCQSGIPEGKADKMNEMPESGKARGLGLENIPHPVANGLAKAMLVQAESENTGRGRGVISSVLLRGNEDTGELGQVVKVTGTELVDDIAAKMPNPIKEGEFKEASQASKIFKQAYKQNLEAVQKPEHTKAETVQKLEHTKAESDGALNFSKKGKDENGFLQSARGRAILNRLEEMGMTTSKDWDLSKKPESIEASKESIETKGKTEPKSKAAEPLQKAIGEVSIGETGDGRMKIAMTEIARPENKFGGRAVENLDEIAEKIELAMDKIRDKGKNVMRVRLRPEELGSIEIRLAQENGIVKGRILVESEAVKEQLSNFLAEEKALLLQSGQRIKEIEVGVFNQQTGPFRDFNQSDFSFNREPGNERHSEFPGKKADIPMDQMQESRLHSGGLDMFA